MLLKEFSFYLLNTTPRHSVKETILLLMIILMLLLLLLLLTSEFEEVKQETNKQQDENKKTRKIDEECHYIFDFYPLRVSMGVLCCLCV